MKFGIPEFFKSKVEENKVTEDEAKKIKEGKEDVDVLENSMDAEKIAEETQNTDVDKRTDFSEPEEVENKEEEDERDKEKE